MPVEVERDADRGVSHLRMEILRVRAGGDHQRGIGVAKVVGRGRMIHAPQSGRSVEVVGLGGSSYARGVVAARRLVGA
jgi:hypothetical protein